MRNLYQENKIMITENKAYVVIILIFFILQQFSWAEPAVENTLLTMVPVPAGKFQRNSSTQDVSCVSEYCISSTEVTRDQFKSIMGIDPSDTSVSSSLNDPVQSINWYHCIAFCNKLSLEEGRTPAYSIKGISDWSKLSYSSIPKGKSQIWDSVVCDWTSNGYRLPTEMEWMWAAMGAPSDGQNGSINTSGYMKRFSGDDGTNRSVDYANVASNHSVYFELGSLGTLPVAQRKPNELGLYDMTGNVWEWCWDWFSNTGGPHQNNGKGQEYKIMGTVQDYRGGIGSDYMYGPIKIIRGGGSASGDNQNVLSYRMISPTTNATDNNGFRIARSK